MQLICVTDSRRRSADILSVLERENNGTLTVADALDPLLDQLSRDGVLVLDWPDSQQVREFVSQVKQRYRYCDHAFLVVVPPYQDDDVGSDLPAEVIMLRRPLDEEDLVQQVRRLTRPFGEPVHVDVRYVNPFIRATAHTVETLTGLPIARNDLFVKRDYRMFGDISGVMGLTGTANGAVVLSFPEDVAVRLVGKMINRELKHGIDHVVRDGVGEFVNVIAGNAKAALANTPYHFNITLPSVVAGTGHLITHRTGTPCVVVVFDIGGGEAALQVCLAPGNGD